MEDANAQAPVDGDPAPEGTPAEARGEPMPQLMGAFVHLHDAHDAINAATDRAEKQYPDDKELREMLDDAHGSVVGCRDHIRAHQDAAAQAKNTAQSTLGMIGSFFAGGILGHLQTLPPEPKSGLMNRVFPQGLSPEMKSRAVEVVQQGAALLMAWLEAQKAAAAAAGVGKPPKSNGTPEPEPAVTPPPQEDKPS